MQINYNFSLNGTTVHPLCGEDLTHNYEKQTDEEFFRKKLSGSISFIGEDFNYINSQPISTEFFLTISENDDPTVYAQGKFYKTDCDINLDDNIIDVKIQAKDNYDNVIDGLNNLYDFSKLATPRTRLYIDKRAMIQTYVPDDNTVSCFFNGNSWEQDVNEPTSDPTPFNFSLAETFYRIAISGTGTPQDVIDDYTSTDNINFTGGSVDYSMLKRDTKKYNIDITASDKDGTDAGSLWVDGSGNQWLLSSDFGVNRLSQFLHVFNLPSGGTLTHLEGAVHTSDLIYTNSYFIGSYVYFTLNTSMSIVFYSKDSYLNTDTDIDIPMNPYLSDGIGSGSVNGFKGDIEIYARYLLDLENIRDLETYPIAIDDLVADNRNYSRVIGYSLDNFTITSNRIDSPTKYGIADDNKYYSPPYYPGINFHPLSRSNWGLSSLWFNFDVINNSLEEDSRKSFLSKDNILLSDAIKLLLGEIDNNITHEGTSEYSELLYSDSNPLTGVNTRRMLNQKSNVIAGELDEPAKKEEIRLSTITAMLKNTYEAFWFIDDQSRFRIEHISWFKNGGSYITSSIIGEDLTTLIDTRNKKPFALYSSKYAYDKESLPGRYEFEWMDDVTNIFKGYPIIINSGYVEKANIKQIQVSEITTDVDYILLNPNEISNDGYVLFDAYFQNTNFFDINDPNNALGQLVDYTTGLLEVYAQTNTTSLRGVEPEQDYTFTNWAAIAWYDYNGVYISGNHYTSDTRLTITSPVGAHTVRVSTFTGSDWTNLEIKYGVDINGVYRLPYVDNNYEGEDIVMQNGLLSWLYLHPRYWNNNLPSYDFNMNDGELVQSTGIKRSKIQNVSYPSAIDPDPTKLIKTYLGNGDIEKISVNLSSRYNNIELRYDTE